MNNADRAPLYFLVKTTNGYVGRWSVNDALSDNCPKARAYTYDTKEKADEVAAFYASFGGAVEAVYENPFAKFMNKGPRR